MGPITLVKLGKLRIFLCRNDAANACGNDDIRRIHPICDDGKGNWYVDFTGNYTNVVGYVVFPPTVDVS